MSTTFKSSADEEEGELTGTLEMRVPSSSHAATPHCAVYRNSSTGRATSQGIQIRELLLFPRLAAACSW